MRWIRVWIALVPCLFVVAVSASALDRKAGLWELTTTMTWQKSPYGGGGNPATAGGPHTTSVCFTQQQIEKYRAILPPLHPGCQIVNLVKKAGGMTADMVCTGKMSGKASVASSWSDAEHATGHMHFVGSIQAGPHMMPIEWTTESSSVFNGADCGAVKPFQMPDK